jgi:FkbM family methyltransferase
MRDKLRRYLEAIQKIRNPWILQLLERVTSKTITSYSSCGEDSVVRGILDRYMLQFGEYLELSYIDIGGWRPINGSNTYFLYRKGFRGTIVEPNPHFRQLWRSVRGEDQYLEVGCSSSSKEELLIFHDGASSNTFDAQFANEISKSQPFSIHKSLEVNCLPLSEIISIHLKNCSEIFLLDIDVEGRDFEVLKTHDFSIGLRPVLILIEDIATKNSSIKDSEISDFLSAKDYFLTSRTAITSIYVDKTHKISSCVSKLC